MAEYAAAPGAAPSLNGKLADNVLLFARLLRATGLQVGTGKILDAIIKKDRDKALDLLEKDLITVSKSLEPISDILPAALMQKLDK